MTQEKYAFICKEIISLIIEDKNNYYLRMYDRNGKQIGDERRYSPKQLDPLVKKLKEKGECLMEPSRGIERVKENFKEDINTLVDFFKKGLRL